MVRSKCHCWVLGENEEVFGCRAGGAESTPTPYRFLARAFVSSAVLCVHARSWALIAEDWTNRCLTNASSNRATPSCAHHVAHSLFALTLLDHTLLAFTYSFLAYSLPTPFLSTLFLPTLHVPTPTLPAPTAAPCENPDNTQSFWCNLSETRHPHHLHFCVGPNASEVDFEVWSR